VSLQSIYNESFPFEFQMAPKLGNRRYKGLIFRCKTTVWAGGTCCYYTYRSLGRVLNHWTEY